jgi:hypothetical protein
MMKRISNLIIAGFMILAFGSSSFADENQLEYTQGMKPNDIPQSQVDYSVSTLRYYAANFDLSRDYLAAQVKHHKELMYAAENAYNIQHWMSIGIFIIVVVMVIGGLYLSFLQFKHSVEKPASSPSGGDDNNAGNTVKISGSGIEISSSVIGLIVLFMSFLFFYLYIMEVYTIKKEQVSPINFQAVKEPAETPASK